MATELPTTANGATPNGTASSVPSASVKEGLARMLKGGVIMDVVNAEQARIAEEAGAAAVMALERVPADIRAQGGVARMSDPKMIKEIMEAVTIPVMAKARIGHFVECQVCFVGSLHSRAGRGYGLADYVTLWGI
jgi:pyridoxal 5'-phosphate synthase pdxS subunit